MAILLERGDIHEELDRMMIHLDSMTTLLEAKSPIGRELIFDSRNEPRSKYHRFQVKPN